jgi:hypothetical protein
MVTLGGVGDGRVVDVRVGGVEIAAGASGVG